MKSSTKRFYSLLLGICLLVGALFVFSSFVGPEYSEIQRLRGERQAKLDLLKDYQVTADALNSLLNKYRSVAELQNTLALSLPLSEQAPGVFNQLQGLAIGNNLRMDSLSFQYLPVEYNDQTSILKPVGVLRVAVKAVGTYDNFKKFLQAVETNVRILDVASLTLEGGGVVRNPSLTYNLVVDTYYQGAK